MDSGSKAHSDLFHSSIQRNPKMGKQVILGPGRAEAAHSNESAIFADVAIPAKAHRGFHGDPNGPMTNSMMSEDDPVRFPRAICQHSAASTASAGRSTSMLGIALEARYSTGWRVGPLRPMPME